MIITMKHVFFDKGVLGINYGCEIIHENFKFNTTEQLIVYLKARYFNDNEAAEKVINCKILSELKSIDNSISGVDENIWNSIKEEIILEALRLKCDSCKDFRESLMNPKYKLKEFVYCKPGEFFYSSGLPINSASKLPEKQWVGCNLLGKCLTKLKSELWKQNMGLR